MSEIRAVVYFSLLRPLLWFLGIVLCMCSTELSPELTLFCTENRDHLFIDLYKLILILSNPQVSSSFGFSGQKASIRGVPLCPAHASWLALPSE